MTVSCDMCVSRLIVMYYDRGTLYCGQVFGHNCTIKRSVANGDLRKINWWILQAKVCFRDVRLARE